MTECDLFSASSEPTGAGVFSSRAAGSSLRGRQPLASGALAHAEASRWAQTNTPRLSNCCFLTERFLFHNMRLFFFFIDKNLTFFNVKCVVFTHMYASVHLLRKDQIIYLFKKHQVLFTGKMWLYSHDSINLILKKKNQLLVILWLLTPHNITNVMKYDKFYFKKKPHHFLIKNMTLFLLCFFSWKTNFFKLFFIDFNFKIMSVV